MNKSTLYRVIFIAAILFAAVIVHSSPVCSEQHPVQTAPQPAKVVDNGFDIVLLMDCSGSMKETDPRSFRKPAAQLFITLLTKLDRVSIISFGENVKTLLNLTEVSDKNMKAINKAVAAINSKELATNIYLAVKSGYEELGRSDRQNRIMILMSDGKLALGTKERDEEALASLNALMPEVVKSGIKLYSIAFTDLSDMKFLEEIARSGKGFSKIAKEDKDIHLVFTDLFEKIKSPDTVPIEGDTFRLDKDINEAIVVVNKNPGAEIALYDPSGKQHTGSSHAADMKWHTATVFEMISIQSPAQGDWKVKLSKSEGNKVFVITNLRLMSSFNHDYVNKGASVNVDAWLQKDDMKIGSKGVLGQTYFYSLLTKPDGSKIRVDMKLPDADGQKDEPDDSVRSAEVIADQNGDYTINIVAEGPAFKREKVFNFKVVDAPAQAAHEVEPKPVASKKRVVRVFIPLDNMKMTILFAGINLCAAALFVGIFLLRKKKASLKSKSDAKKKPEDRHGIRN
ncbi:MAG: vWA domain-containing protein [Dissulfurispiraceae bacterium]|jgi:Mg-chelatase subunit ChlD|nr:vWA domain-containing protein [Dissulfurispiraceae bacterium]